MTQTSFIRLARQEDAATIQAIYAPFVQDSPVSFELVPPALTEMQQRIKQVLEGFPWLVYEQQGEVLGYAYASQHSARAAYQWSVDVSAYIHTSWHRHGLGRVLYTSLFELLRLQGFYHVYAGITLPNPASIALHEKMGMQQVGIYQHVGYKLGAWHDVGWWQGALQPERLEPAPPKPLNEAINLIEWDTALTSGTSLIRK